MPERSKPERGAAESGAARVYIPENAHVCAGSRMFIHASAHRTVYRVRTRRRGGPHAAKKKQLVAVLSLFASHTGPETCEEPSMRRASFLLMNAVGAVSAFSCLDSAAVGVKGQRSRVGRRDIGLPSGCTRCSATAMLLSGAHAALAGVDLGCHDGRLMVAGNETDCQTAWHA